MNILIPLAGKDPEFEKRGLFKPLVDVGGQPLILRCTSQHPALFSGGKNKLTFIVLAEHEKKFSASSRLKGLYPGSSVLIMPKPSEGAACTALFAKGAIGGSEPLAIYLADIHFEMDFAAAAKRCKEGGCAGFIPCFPSSNRKYSYAARGEGKLASRVAEKDAISQNASAGFYYFSRGSDFVEAAERMVEKGLRANGAFYVCPVYNELIGMGKKVLIEDVKFISGLGNIAEIEAFRKSVALGAGRTLRHLIYAHRGMHGKGAPENSLKALADAASGGRSPACGCPC